MKRSHSAPALPLGAVLLVVLVAVSGSALAELAEPGCCQGTCYRNLGFGSRSPASS